ncbi:hypothetical protein GCM10011492_06690 [Flexivirga endophytica]|uniref:Uncharacterized protein n=1 Tax=Flexivirga endophytica TaxID=1849103 RepID=A0A916WQ87_9MICO|nr:hypothetical protein [Flexivirga endophytica]GGB19511.1 hypothetical protein GCM10011492_06690 [Flexivirga endophytica]GHB36187.1 hypothetical protein GCM10008112_00920 [Flexivirga endophytica]
MNAPKRTPNGLNKRGRAYWKITTEAYELTDSEQALLLEVCRCLDNLDQLAAAIETHGAMVAGAAGQPVVNPALTEARGQRAILHRLIAALALPDVDGDAVPTGHSLRGAAANQARWKGHKRVAG